MLKLPPLTIIPAGAGSGKTYTIQKKITEWVEKKIIEPERVIAVTFTETAAGELRERIRFALLTDPKVDMEQVLALDQAYITTIHGFGLRLLQEYCFEGGWSPIPRLLTEDEGDILIRQALAVTRKADAIMADLRRFGYQWDRFKGSAEDQFRDQLSRLIQKHRILGSNGINKRIKSHLLKKIKTLYGRTQKADVLEKQLFKAVTTLLKKFPDSLADLYTGDRTATYRNTMVANYRSLSKARKKGALKADWDLWLTLQELRTSKRGTALPDDYDDSAEKVMAAAGQLYRHPGPLGEALLHAGSLVDAVQECLDHHTSLKRNKSLVDYGDMLSLSHELLTSIPDVLQDLSSKVDCVVIDEFQDTNPLQFSLLWALYRQGIPTLIVGDVKQAIMGFQDADSRLLEALEKSGMAKSSPLKQNWRTVKPLMEFLNAASKGLFPDTYQKLTPKVTGTSKLNPLHILNFCNYSRGHAFYGDHVADHIQSILESNKKVLEKGTYRPVRGSDIAILLPTHKLIETYAESFRKAGLQVQVEEDGWFESRSVQILYYALLYTVDPKDRHAALYLTVTELGQGGLESSVKDLINGRSLNEPLLEKLSSISTTSITTDVYSLLNEVIAALNLFTNISTWPNGSQERANILRFLAEAEEFTGINTETLEASGLHGFGVKTFLAWLLNRKESDDTLPRTKVVDDNAITLSTWHGAKGKEWPIVAVCGTFKDYKAKLPSLNIEYKDFANLDDILKKAVVEFSPTFHANETVESFLDTLQDEAESNAKRLLYVAMTRAKEQLILERAGHQEGKDTISYWNLFRGCSGIVIDGKTIENGTKSFSCTQTNIGKDEATLTVDLTQIKDASLPCLGLRAIKSMSLPEVTPESIRPSQISGGKIGKKIQITTHKYGSPLDIDLKKGPAEAGVILHRCFEVLDGQDDRTDLLEPATGHVFTKQQKKDLQTAVEAFESWCHKIFGAIELYKEIPVSYQNEDGIIVSGIIDLLIESKEGYWVFDHKTHIPTDSGKEFLDYWPQLQAYCEGLDEIGVKKKVLGTGVNWVVNNMVSLSKWSGK